MFGYYFFLIANFIIIAAMFWFLYIVIKLFISEEYRKSPPFVPSFGNEKVAMIKEVRTVLKNSQKQLVILDPGCGIGTLLLRLAKDFPNHKFVGIEWNKVVAGICSIRAWRLKNLKIISDDMFNHDFGKADLIVCFLLPEMLDRFGKKLLNDRKKPQIVFSNSFQIPNLKLEREIKTGRGILFKNIYVYRL